jgi:GMP synthase (glutamine-hydrolysing)
LPPPALFLLRNGDVPPEIARRRGQFTDWIAAPLRHLWPGPIHAIDARLPLPPDLLQASAVILSGSPSSVTERAPWMLDLEAALRALLARQTPLLGICFGHQIIASAAGGEVQRNPLGREIGTIAVQRLSDDPLFHGLPSSFLVNATHVDTVTRLPAGARLLATSTLDHVAAYALGSARGVQFHPEMDGDVIRSLLQIRRPIIEAEGLPFEPLLSSAQDAPAGPAILQNFIEKIALPSL